MSKTRKTPEKIADKGMEKGSEAAGAVGGAAAGGLAGAGIGALGALLTGGTLTPAIKGGAKVGADMGANVGKEIGKGVGKAGKMGRKTSGVAKALSNPLNTFSDKAIKLLVDFIIPIPILGEYAGDIVTKYKYHIGFAALSGLMVIVLSLGGGEVKGISARDSYISDLPIELEGYVEEGFYPTEIPERSPLGGDCFEYTVITSYFDDPNYYARFGRWHKALDMVPSPAYYSQNEAFRRTGEIIMFANMSGEAQFLKDGNGALMVKIVNDSKTLEVGYAHLKTSFVETGDYVNPGDPIGIMGETGLSYGVHLHYWIVLYDAKTNTGTSVDPYPYLFGNCS